MQQTKETFTQNESAGKETKVLCLDCKQTTNHRIEASLDKHGCQWDEQERWSIDWVDHYQVIRCLGCDNVSFRHTSWFSEDDPMEPATERLYPRRNSLTISEQSFLNIPSPLKRIYGEVIDSFNSENFTLCAAGLRAIVEGICADQKIVDGPVVVNAAEGATKVVRKTNLEGMIAGLQEKGLLTQQNTVTLHDHRFLGNDAVHQLKKPSAEELKLAIEIVEHTLHQIYELPEKALELRQSMAKRKK